MTRLIGYEEGITEASASLYNPQTDIADIVNQLETYAEIRQAIKKLSPQSHRRIKSYFFDGLTHQEIADMEGVNQSTVSRSINRSLKKLEIILKNMHENFV